MPHIFTVYVQYWYADATILADNSVLVCLAVTSMVNTFDSLKREHQIFSQVLSNISTPMRRSSQLEV